MSNRQDAPSRPEGFGAFLRNVNFVFLSTVLSYGIAFATTVVIARVLGPEGRGVTALYQASVGAAFAVVSFGIGAAVIYFIVRRELTPRQALEAGLTVTLAAAAVTGVAVLLTALLFGHELRGEHVPYWLALVAVPAVVQYRLLEGVLRAQGRFGAMNFLELFLPATLLAGLVAVEVTAGLTIARTVVVWSLAFLPPVAVGYILAGFEAWPRRPEVGALLSRTLGFGLQGQVSNLVQLLNYRLDSYLVLFFIDKAAVGYYAVAVTLSEGLWFIANSVATVAVTDFTANDEERAGNMAALVCRNTIAVSVVAAVGAAIVSPFFIPAVYGSDFDDSLAPFLLLLPGTIALAGAKVLSAYVFSRGRPMINAWIALVTLAATLALDLVLIPWLGVSGAALGASIPYGLSLALTAAAYRRLSGGSIAGALLPRASDLSIYTDLLRAAVARVSPSRRAPSPEG